MKKLALSGTAKEIGYEHGSKGKKEVIHSLETYEKLFHGYKQIDWQQAREYALEHVDSIEKYDYDLVEEMQGVAEGAGVDFEDILALNARSEIALAGYKGSSFSDGCTAMALYPPIHRDTIIAQNWDWKGRQTDSLLALSIQQQNKPDIQMITEGGMIGKIGWNSSGVGVCFNALLTDKKSNEVPIHLGLRGVLDSYSLTEAISKIKAGQMASAASFLIGADEGEPDKGMAVNFEVSPFGIYEVGTQMGRLVHSNHLLSNELKKHLKDMNEFRFDDSMIRKKRAEQLIDLSLQSGEDITEDTFKTWLSDTFNKPNSINHYKNELAPEHRQMETVFSIIMNLSKKNMYVCVGKPAEGTFEKITFES
ncbi:C45 family peptidase [Radiobacillus kanasensis]|uniref:C45 family autoproteolytic acyltransferase/hydolase n=1 Tax=Radiobacillus kanasensis TaxID=2844358 RepID=UPI001E5832BE|nr:C45 family peptidase [Radiobacillus kanasensis]UFT99091.1 C45 family peptidase [Radiobacillus kanasensis]